MFSTKHQLVIVGRRATALPVLCLSLFANLACPLSVTDLSPSIPADGVIVPPPVIASISGTPAHGETIQLQGSRFGSHTLDIEWTGDWIEAQPVGTNPDTKPGWSHVYSLQGIRDHISTNRAWSGSKSIDVSIDQTLDPYSHESTLGYEHAAFDKIYATWWTYVQPTAFTLNGGEYTQLKYAYVTCHDCNGGAVLQAVTNSVMNLIRYTKTDETLAEFGYENNTWVDCPGVQTPLYDTFAMAEGVGYSLPTLGYWKRAINRGADNWNTVRNYAPSNGQWNRNEWYSYRGSAPDVPDGELEFAVVKPGQGRFVGHQTRGVVLQTDRTDCRSEPTDWRRFVFMLFFDDAGVGDRVEKCTINIDDVYMQFGTQARVEMGDSQEYSACTKLEIQIPTQWSRDSISLKVNRPASFALAQTAYLFVVRDDGTVSSGYPINFN